MPENGEIGVRSFVMAAPGIPGPPGAMELNKMASRVAPPVVVRKTFPESWLWETDVRLVLQLMFFVYMAHQIQMLTCWDIEYHIIIYILACTRSMI